MKNLNVPLPEDLYRQLFSEAERIQRPAVELIREAIDYWLTEQRRQMNFKEIQSYARSVAGTNEDFDSDLEAATIESLLAGDDQDTLE